MRRSVLWVVLFCVSLQGCAVWRAGANKWWEETDRLHGNVAMSDAMADSWRDVDRGWRYLAQGRCADALEVTERVWGREWPGLFEDVTILRVRALACLGRFADALDLLQWMGVMFPWRAEEIGAATVFVRHAMGEDIRNEVWEGVRRYPEGWLHRLLGAQLLVEEGRIRDGMESLRLLVLKQEEMGGRCGYDVVGHVLREADRERGFVNVEPYWRPVGVEDGVVRAGGLYGVIMDYCHDRDMLKGEKGWLEATLGRVFVGRDGTCEELRAKGPYREFWNTCLARVDYDHEDPERLLWMGEAALRMGLTGEAQTSAHALLKRQERTAEAEVLLSRVYRVLGYEHR